MFSQVLWCFLWGCVFKNNACFIYFSPSVLCDYYPLQDKAEPPQSQPYNLIAVRQHCTTPDCADVFSDILFCSGPLQTSTKVKCQKNVKVRKVTKVLHLNICTVNYHAFFIIIWSWDHVHSSVRHKKYHHIFRLLHTLHITYWMCLRM